jgi:hypothetical protein
MRPKRNVKQIKKWMIDRELRVKDIVTATGEERTYVTKTINGSRNNRKVLKYLADNGCPIKHLALPDDMQEAA